jgi:hypothetical protein
MYTSMEVSHHPQRGQKFFFYGMKKSKMGKRE